MVNFDFSNIRTLNGSQNSGFEELVCQLANLQKPNTGISFIRKEGAGGDAGIECFWLLENGEEYGWQAKFFLAEMSASRWSQIDDSFKATLAKHKSLVKYTVCLPLDRTDSRKSGKSGKIITSILDEWNTHVEKWKQLTLAEGRTIDFEYWGKHEIISLLSKDDPRFSGRALFWFNQPLLNSQIFNEITIKSQISLGERYTPEFHVDLPIAKKFDGLSLNPRFWSSCLGEVTKISEQRDHFLNSFNKNNSRFLKGDILQEFDRSLGEFIYLCQNSIQHNYFIAALPGILSLNQSLQDYESKLLSGSEDVLYEEKNRSEATIFRNLFRQLRYYRNFLNSDVIEAAEKRSVLLWGEAGIGKSHLLCDVSINRIKEDLPTVFLLGQHYGGGNPLNFLSEALDLKHHSYKVVLGALDAAGEAKKAQSLIIIDAINEGGARDDWFNHIQNFLSDILSFKYLSVLISCRTTYMRHLIPEETYSNAFVKFEHKGFAGFEHRAASKYLSMQGIVKPSAPITAPEFSNPLFLKTSCKALKANGLTAFPRGIQGFTSIFNFYIDSIEKVIARRKNYNAAEGIVRIAINAFANSFFPNSLKGIQFSKARETINAFDPNLYHGNSLFDELLHENIISEDIYYKEESNERRGIPIARFTYERFSDYFVANQIIATRTEENIKDIFSKENEIGKLLSDQYYYTYRGVLEALSILVAEKFKIEIMDILPRELGINDWELNEMFTETIVWRSPESITARTLQILNSVDDHGYRSTILDTLLKLSTEPGHPWNAEFLHKNLSTRSLPDRDAFWSTYLALTDQTEDEGQSESVVRTIIDWACFGNLDQVDADRMQLCAITLIWFLTTSNRRVRDHATKSLVRVLHLRPALLPDLIIKFNDIDDTYLTERLYAVAYGVVCNIQDKDIIQNIANVIYKHIFSKENVIPHIILRDYARGVLELALHRGLLSAEIDPKHFRPPYKSTWPLSIPSQDEIDSLAGDNFSSAIKASLMGFPGDFGNYTLGAVEDWSVTSLSKRKPETGRQLKKKFAINIPGELKNKFLASIAPEKKTGRKPSIESIVINVITPEDESEWTKKWEREQSEKEELIESISQSLDPTSRAYFEWLSRVDNNKTAAFNKKWVQRWICKRAYELGWTEEKFRNFEANCAHGRGSGGPAHMERIGKKYQWIAFHEFVAHLSDNVHWIDRGYSDLDDREYFGPWQMDMRDIDPTTWIRENNLHDDSLFNKKNTWWQQYQFPMNGIETLDEKINYLWSEEIVPDFSKMLKVVSPSDKTRWTVLRGFWNQHEKDEIDEKGPRLDCWFRINPIIIRKSDFKKLRKAVLNKNLCDPHTVYIPTTQHQGFLKEYPWHSVYDSLQEKYIPSRRFKDLIPVKYLTPISEYVWESGSLDYSINHSMSFYMPCKTLVRDLQIDNSIGDVGVWRDKNGQIIFMDPSISGGKPSYALINSDALDNWLDKNDCKLVWLIGGEKQLFTQYASAFFGRLIFSGIFSLDNGEISGNLWFLKQH